MNLLKIIHQNISSYLNDSIYNLKMNIKIQPKNFAGGGDQDCNMSDSLGQTIQ